jgi:photosystem II stability/assembly factor-like uncharacterized protein
VAISDDGTRIVAVGAAGLVWGSSDGGQSFARVTTGTARDLAAVGFNGDDGAHVVAVGAAGTILRSDDAARSFALVPSSLSANLNAVEDL